MVFLTIIKNIINKSKITFRKFYNLNQHFKLILSNCYARNSDTTPAAKVSPEALKVILPRALMFV